MATNHNQSTKTRKVAAISAGALVVGLGAAFTLASWTDSEWVWGGLDGDANVGTSSFNVQQNTSSALEPDAWTDEEVNPGGELLFSAGALALTPGDTIYAPVSLRTATDSIAGSVQLQGAVAAEGITIDDADGLLWDAMQVDVWVTDGDGSTAPACDAGISGTPGVTHIVSAAGLDTVANAVQDLDAEAGDAQNYCFGITLPDEPANQALQGRTIAPAWEFAAESESL